MKNLAKKLTGCVLVLAATVLGGIGFLIFFSLSVFAFLYFFYRTIFG